MAQILGIGGVFFKAPDRPGLRAWYTRVLGFDITSWGGAVFPHPTRGKTVWSPFAEDTTYFKPSEKPFMINLIVDDIEAMVAKVTAEGVPALDRQEMEGMGKLASIMDPTGIKIELWEPAET